MRMGPALGTLLCATLLCARAVAGPDEFTPLVASTLTARVWPFAGTDGKTHFVYELVVLNASPTTATLKKIEIVDALAPSKPLAVFSGDALTSHLRTTGSSPATDSSIEFNGTRIFLVDFTQDTSAAFPSRLVHRIQLTGGPTPSRKPESPAELSYTIAPIDVSVRPPEIGPPLSGGPWVAVNGCCNQASVHRSTSVACNGGLFFAQRFAIDWMRLDKGGRFVEGDPADVHHYASYGAEVLAVADGKVVDVEDELDDQKPGTLPDPKTITIRNVDGNHIVLDLGNGVFAFYAHIQHGTIKVSLGDRVTRGQVLGKVGNTGNTSAPHLHFHLMDTASALCSQGIPYTIDAFHVDGQVNAADFAAAPGIEGNWVSGIQPTSSARQQQYPLDLEILDFPASK